MSRVNHTITIAAGTPKNAVTGGDAADTSPCFATEIFVQMLTGGTGRGIVMDEIAGVSAGVGRVPSSTSDSDVSMELAPATATAPGGAYSRTEPSGAIDVNQLWIDGSHTGDTVKISFRPRT
jgi:hypothetical protein